MFEFLDFLKRRHYKCPDKTTRVVYKNIDDAFPLALKDEKSKLAASLAVPLHATSHLTSEDETKVHGLLFGLDDLNRGLMLSFRSVYLAYASNPCGGYEFLLRETERIIREQERLTHVRLQIEGLVSLAKNSGKSINFSEQYEKIVVQIQQPAGIAEVAKMEIENAAKQTKEWVVKTAKIKGLPSKSGDAGAEKARKSGERDAS